MDNLKELREKIDSIDDVITEKYVERLNICDEIARIKQADKKAVSDPAREEKILYRVTENVPEELRLYVKDLYLSIFSASKARQNALISKGSPTTDRIKEILGGELKDLPMRAAVACQGVKGANSGAAAVKFFPISDITYFKNFDGVFSAVESGLCEYGVLPIENSTAGSVLEVYDLMKKYDFHIVRSLRLKIEHCLAGVKGASKNTVKKVISHPQALRQCAEYISENKLEAEESENTAVAAKRVAESGDVNIAVLCSPDCAELYGLKIIERSVQDESNNFTRFICIGKDLDVKKGSDKISVMTTLPHKSGSLNGLLTKFSAIGLNLTKIESRPIAGTDFEFMFYFDFDGDVSDPKVLGLISELENSSDKFVFLGTYKEILG